MNDGLEADRQTLMQMLDELAANAWPALVSQQLEGWRMRATNNVTRRANSVLTNGIMPSYGGWLDEITDFYRRQSLPVRFQVSDASPSELDPLLDELGYTSEGGSTVQTARCFDVLERSASLAGYDIASYNSLDDTWLDSFLEIEGIGEEKKETYWLIMSRIGPRVHFVQICLDSKVAGIGMAVSERGWSGLFNIATRAEYRRRGIGGQVVRSLAEWSLQTGAQDLYLQVMLNNQAALSLYGRLGFAPLYNYHYRSKPLR
ncbi:MAG TPA: GNAT family N-acetyltransferase [Chloroflexia bacterium]|nr:GNAT family N-acetyltransferase [Chloroflexia bacterium]